MSEDLVPLSQIRSMAEVACKSGLFPAMRSPDQVATLMMLCHAKKMHPIQALQQYHIVQGRPAMRSDAMLANFQQNGGIIEFVESSTSMCHIRVSAPSIKNTFDVCWTIEDAKRAGLDGRDAWKQYPRQMLRARAIAEAVRMAMPSVVTGIYTEEEVSDMTSSYKPEKPQIIDAEVEPVKVEMVKSVFKGATEVSRSQELEVKIREISQLPVPNGLGWKGRRVVDEMKQVVGCSKIAEMDEEQRQKFYDHLCNVLTEINESQKE